MNIKIENRYLYSRYNPEEAARKAASSILETLQRIPRTLYIIPSPLLWYGVEALQNVLRESTLIALEFDDDLFQISKSPTNPVPLYHGNSFNNRTLETLDGWPFRKIVFLPLNQGYRLHHKQYSNFMENFTNQIQDYWRNRMTMLHLLPRWVKNIFRNLRFNEENSFLPLSSLFTNKPVFLCGAGESIEESLSFLMTHREEFFILSLDTTLPLLVDIHLKPDGILAVDAQFYNLQDFVGSARFSDVPLIMDASLYPGISQLHNGPKYLFHTDFWQTSLVARLKMFIPDHLPPFGSVGIAGLEIASRITSNFIICGGLDFCFDLGKSHARGSTYGKYTLRKWTRLAPFPMMSHQLNRYPKKILRNNGKPGYSDISLINYATITRNWFEGNNRFYRFGSGGMELGITQWEENTITDSPTVTNQEYVKKGMETGPISTKSCKDFLRESREKLEALYSAAYSLLESGKGKDRFLRTLQDCDYPVLHIPDFDEKMIHPTQLKRMLMAIQLYLEVLPK